MGQMPLQPRQAPQDRSKPLTASALTAGRAGETCNNITASRRNRLQALGSFGPTIESATIISRNASCPNATLVLIELSPQLYSPSASISGADHQAWQEASYPLCSYTRFFLSRFGFGGGRAAFSIAAAPSMRMAALRKDSRHSGSSARPCNCKTFVSIAPSRAISTTKASLSADSFGFSMTQAVRMCRETISAALGGPRSEDRRIGSSESLITVSVARQRQRTIAKLGEGASPPTHFGAST